MPFLRSIDLFWYYFDFCIPLPIPLWIDIDLQTSDNKSNQSSRKGIGLGLRLRNEGSNILTIPSTGFGTKVTVKAYRPSKSYTNLSKKVQFLSLFALNFKS